MQQLIYFLQKYKYFLYVALLQLIAFALIVNNHSYHKSKFVSSANSITGGLLTKSSEISDYFNLQEQNNALVEENLRLRQLLEKSRVLSDSVLTISVIDSSNFNQQYEYINAKIIKNEYHKSNNHLTINRGNSHGITKEMAVINGKGIVGITDDTGNNYTRVKSILNRNSRINAKFKNSFHFGTLTWNGKNYEKVQLTDIPRQAVYQIGDTIITGGKSTIFPEGILIGIVSKLPEKISASNTLEVTLFNDMTNLGHIYVVKNLHKKEIEELSNSTNE